MCQLANVALETGRTLRFDPKTERFVGDEEANKFLSGDYCEQFLLPEDV